MDREKVIRGLYACTTFDENGVTDGDCKICPYYKGYATGECWVQMNRDALALLEEQEAVEPIISESYRTNSGRMSRRKAWCGACGIGINFDAKFCDHCGKAVKWE